MADLHPGNWYRLIGGERVRVEAFDAGAGIATVHDADGHTLRLARTAFVGATREADPGTPAPESGPTGEPDDGVVATATASDEPDSIQEDAMQDAREAQHATTDDPAAGPAEPPRRGDAHGAQPATRPGPDIAPGETGKLDFDDGDDHAAAGATHGLSPLALGMLLGMLLLAGIAGWLVLQSRLDSLETQFEQLDERLQVVMGDTRRQGEALRAYLADPRAPRPPASPAAAAPAKPADAELATLERQLAVQVERVAALERRLANQDAGLAELDRRAGVLEKRPLPITTAPAQPQAARERDTTPSAPPAGYVVVLASLPVREQALQELDSLRARGLSVVLREARIKDATWYRIQAEGFRDRDAATAFARAAETRHGVAGAWVVAP